MDIFKQASKSQLRFQTSKGLLNVEQLWSLTQTDLTNAIRNLKKSLKKDNDDDLGFLDADTKVNAEDQLRFDILKDVYLTKKSDAEALRTSLEKKQFEQKILSLIADKKDTELAGKSIEELTAMLAK